MMQHGAGFRVCGAVVRKFVVASGKCAFLTLKVDGHPRPKTLEFKAFGDMVEAVGSLSPGQTIEVTGVIDSETVKNKAKEEIKVDDRAKWVPMLAIKALRHEGAQPGQQTFAPPPQSGAESPRPPVPAPTAAGWDEEDVPF